jgi:hypothetical protein
VPKFFRQAGLFGVLIASTAFGAMNVLLPAPASAIPYFAHEYGLTCQKCHTVIPRLNAFGLAFLDHGYQLPGARPDHSVSPLSTKVNFVYGSDPGAGEPKAVVDEVEAYLAGTLGPRTSYFIEQYVIDGGFPGLTREAWLAERLSGDGSKAPVFVQGGSFTLPLPVDPETFRETYTGYAPFVQTTGVNPFNFFDPKIGLQLRLGSIAHGISGDADALQGHDRQSGLPSDGNDFMQYVQDAAGPVTLSAYRYEGKRPAVVEDRFYRQGYGFVVADRRFESDTVLQSGFDSSVDGLGTAARSSGGFEQLRYQFSPRYFGLARFEGTNDPVGGASRDVVVLAGFRLARNARLTLEDVFQRSPQISTTVASQLTIGY